MRRMNRQIIELTTLDKNEADNFVMKYTSQGYETMCCNLCGRWYVSAWKEPV